MTVSELVQDPYLSKRLLVELSTWEIHLSSDNKVLILGGTAPWESLDSLELDWLAGTQRRNQIGWRIRRSATSHLKFELEKTRLFPAPSAPI